MNNFCAPSCTNATSAVFTSRMCMPIAGGGTPLWHGLGDSCGERCRRPSRSRPGQLHMFRPVVFSITLRKLAVDAEHWCAVLNPIHVGFRAPSSLAAVVEKATTSNRVLQPISFALGKLVIGGSCLH